MTTVVKNVSENLAARVKEHFGDSVIVNVAYGEVTMTVDSKDIIKVCTDLRDKPELAFEELIDLCGVDYLAYGQAEWETSSATGSGFSRGVEEKGVSRQSDEENLRFAVVYHLLSIKHNCRLRVKAMLSESSPVIDSVIDIWSSVNWFEREAFDLFGIMFAGHPDLRRILTDYGFIGHPFRKDFPLIGNVEMRYDANKKRVIYEPVSIEPRTLVPKVIRDDQKATRTAGGGE
ncbi:NADH-quinone oxidoreductase subunit C [Kaarinaea lacus]